MFESVFGSEIPVALRFAIAVVVVAVLIFFIVWAIRRVLHGAFPSAKPQYEQRLPNKYAGLRSISYLLRAIGWLAILLGIFGLIVVGFGQMDNVARQFGIILGFGNLGLPVNWIIISVSISGLTWGILVLAFGELIRVLVDIALNTEPLPAIAQDTNYFYERFSTPPQQVPTRDPR